MTVYSRQAPSEVAGHFRSALDYLIGQLANLDSGPGERRTQLPIESTPEGFKKRRDSFLEGVNDAHVAAIERLQPYIEDVSGPKSSVPLITSTSTTNSLWLPLTIAFPCVSAETPQNRIPLEERLR